MSDKTTQPKNDIISPAVGNKEAFKNLGGMPEKKTTEETHDELKPSFLPKGVSPSKSRVM